MSGVLAANVITRTHAELDLINQAAVRDFFAHEKPDQVDLYDPWIDIQEAEHEYGLQCLAQAPAPGQYAAIVLAVGHHQFMAMGEEGLKALGQPGAVLYEVKSILPLGAADGRL